MPDGGGNVYWQLIFYSNDAVFAQAEFAKFGIDVATTSLELVCELEGYPNRVSLYNARSIYYNGVFIPCFPGLTTDDKKRVINAMRCIYK